VLNTAVREATPTLRLDVVTDARGLAALQTEWDVLLQSTASNTIFLTWDWIATWWEIYGSTTQLHVVTARDQTGTLVGIAPLQIVKHRPGIWKTDIIQFIGCGSDVTPEYLDFIVAPGLEESVIPRFLAHLDANRRFAYLDLRPFAAQSRCLSVMESFFAARGGGIRRTLESVCPVLSLPESLEEFTRTRSSHYRKNIGYYDRRCVRDLSVNLRVAETPADVRAQMTTLMELHGKRWDGQSRAFRSQQYRAFHERLACLGLKRGWTRLFTLESRARPLAVLYCFHYGGRYYFYQTGRDPEFDRFRVGQVLLHRVIQEAIKEHARSFDFLRGPEGYKYQWDVEEIRNDRLIAWKDIPGRVAVAADACSELLARVQRTNRAELRSAARRRIGALFTRTSEETDAAD
jgi:CelD/BcsL family acetyltransferase involved in cellulose biosynthesis